MVNIQDLGNSTNYRSSEVLARMIGFGQLAADQPVTIGKNNSELGKYQTFEMSYGTDGYRDSSLDYRMTVTVGTMTVKLTLDQLKSFAEEPPPGTTTQQWNDRIDAFNQYKSSGQSLEANSSETAHVIAGCMVKVGDTILAGGMVALQAKIDGMLSTVQMSIKNAGQVNQVLQAAARG